MVDPLLQLPLLHRDHTHTRQDNHAQDNMVHSSYANERLALEDGELRRISPTFVRKRVSIMVFSETLKKAGTRALGGGVPGAIAMVLQVRACKAPRCRSFPLYASSLPTSPPLSFTNVGELS